MVKRRKRTNKDVPAKYTLKRMADQLWSLAVRDDWNNCCAVCGKHPCHAHHLVPRQHYALRFDLRNGIALCHYHHTRDSQISPHQNAAGWMHWLSDNHPLRYEWYVDVVAEGRHRSFQGTKNAVYYMDIIQGFREYVEPEVFEKVVGVRFNAYLMEQS